MGLANSRVNRFGAGVSHRGRVSVIDWVRSSKRGTWPFPAIVKDEVVGVPTTQVLAEGLPAQVTGFTSLERSDAAIQGGTPKSVAVDCHATLAMTTKGFV